MKLLYLILSFLVLTSCATVDSSYKGADAGYAVISLTLDHEDSFLGLDESKFDFFQLTFADIHASKPDDFMNFTGSKHGLGWPAPDLKDKDSQTFVIVSALRPGRYKIFHTLLEAGGDYKVQVWNKLPFSIYFNIKPNEYSYLGNFHGVATTEKALLFGKKIKGGYIIVRDYQDRDIKLGKIKNPSLKMDVVTNSIPNLDIMANPFFIKEQE